MIDTSRFTERDFEALARARDLNRCDHEYYHDEYYAPIPEAVIEFVVEVFNLLLLDADDEIARPRMYVWRDEMIIHQGGPHIISANVSAGEYGAAVYVLFVDNTRAQSIYEYPGVDPQSCAELMIRCRRNEETQKHGVAIPVDVSRSSSITRLSALGYHTRPVEPENHERTRTDWTRTRTLTLPCFPEYGLVVDYKTIVTTASTIPYLPMNMRATAFCMHPPAPSKTTIMLLRRRMRLAREAIADILLDRPTYTVYGDALLFRHDGGYVGNETFHDLLARSRAKCVDY